MLGKYFSQLGKPDIRHDLSVGSYSPDCTRSQHPSCFRPACCVSLGRVVACIRIVSAVERVLVRVVACIRIVLAIVHAPP